jgi:hypothetical protein
MSTLSRSRAGGQRAAQETPEVGMASSSAWISAHDWLSQLGTQLEPQACHQNY